MNTEARPFLKWAGGKGQLLSQLDVHLPQRLKSEEFTYIEPFVGGGAMFFHILQRFHTIRKAIINDINPYLMTAYQVIKDFPNELILELSYLQKEYYSLNSENAKKEFYLEVRDTFNRGELNDLDRAKYLVFLNRTCFNGLYRVNSKGKFNVPFGRHSHPMICNSDIIMANSELMNLVDVHIMNGDFEQTLNEADERLNFFYIDPPYRPLNETSSFNSYAKEDFNDNEQIRLRDFCVGLDERNYLWMLSNADCSAKNPNDTFFEQLYNGFTINRVYANRAINANPSKRGKLTELLIKNYE